MTKNEYRKELESIKRKLYEIEHEESESDNDDSLSLRHLIRKNGFDRYRPSLWDRFWYNW